jgi:hypothetical protein
MYPSIPELIVQEIDLGGQLYGVVVLPPSPHVHKLARDLVTPSRKWPKGGVLHRIGEGVALASKQHQKLMEAQKSSWAGAPLDPSAATEHVRAAKETFEIRIREFLEEYSVTGASPVPFGGREFDLASLDRWLANNGAAPRLVLGAPGGCGKSALLVNWMERLAIQNRLGPNSNQWQLVFVPISARVNTTAPEVFYQLIAARLAEILDHEFDPPHATPALYYQDQCRRLLDLAIEAKTRILLIIDGIDEAIGGRFTAKWFPRTPGSFLRLLVSSRLELRDRNARDLTRRLGWTSGVRTQQYDLPKLDLAGVLDLLQSAGAPKELLIARPEIVDKLHFLSGGEPLLLKFYAEDLWPSQDGSPLRIEDLQDMEPSWWSYFSDWIVRQREAWEAEGLGSADKERGKGLSHDLRVRLRSSERRSAA